MATLPVHWQFMTRWDDPTLDWQGDHRVRSAIIDLGDPDDPDRPLVAVIEYAPNITVRPHTHPSDYCSIVVRGSVEVTRQQHGVGSIRFVKAGTVYGPLVAGPEGTTLIDIFADRNGYVADWGKVDDEADRERLAQVNRNIRARLDALQPYEVPRREADSVFA